MLFFFSIFNQTFYWFIIFLFFFQRLSEFNGNGNNLSSEMAEAIAQLLDTNLPKLSYLHLDNSKISRQKLLQIKKNQK